MATLPQTIHDKPIYFFSKQFFLVYVMGDDLSAGPQGIFGRQVFTKFSSVEMKREARKHRESGSKYPWIGGDVEEITAVTLSRGLSYLKEAADFGLVTGVAEGAQLQLYNFYKNPTATDGSRYTLICEIYDDHETGVSGETRDPLLYYRLEGVYPTRYKGFEGDASSSDTVEEELELEVAAVKQSSDGVNWL